MIMWKQTQGFTLVELLIVVVVIVILLSLLVPAMDKVLWYADKVHCAGNLHAIGKGIAQYAAEFKRTPQRGDQSGDPAGDSWDNGFRAGGGREARLEDDDVVAEKVPAERRPLYRYVSPLAFECPNDDISFESRGGEYHSLYEARGSSYWMQPSADEPNMALFYVSYLGKSGDGPFDYFAGVIGRPIRSFRQPHKLILMSDAPAWFTPYSFGGIAYSFHDEQGRQETPEGRQHAWNNCLYADGTVRYTHILGVQDDFVGEDYTFAYREYNAAKMGSRGR